MVRNNAKECEKPAVSKNTVYEQQKQNTQTLCGKPSSNHIIVLLRGKWAKIF